MTRERIDYLRDLLLEAESTESPERAIRKILTILDILITEAESGLKGEG